MDHKPSLSPRDFFLHFGLMIALYVSMVSLISLLFQVIDYVVGDAIRYGFYSSGLRTSIAFLVIFFPVFLILGWIFQRDVSAVPEKLTVGVRKWLVYLTLFVAGLSVIIDLVVLLNSFLGGEITTSFALKVLAVFLVAGLTFVYYVLDLKNGPAKHEKLYRTFALFTGVVVVASIVGAFMAVGSPMTQRKIRLDEVRVNNLYTLKNTVDMLWSNKKVLPQSLEEIKKTTGEVGTTDPETKVPYEYRVIGADSYELCATFDRSTKSDTTKPYSYYGYGTTYNLHDAGRVCFTEKVDPKLNRPVGY